MAIFQSFTIRCSRNIHNVDEDDTIRIKARWNTINEDCKFMEFVVRHRVAECSGEEDTEQIITGSHLTSYIGNLIDLLAVDIQPFKQIQFDFPCMPSIIVTPSQIQEIRHVIMSATYGLQTSWPTMVITKAKKPSTPLNVFAESFVPKVSRVCQSHDTPQRKYGYSVEPPRIERRAPRHIFFDEEDGRVTRYFD